ncbi:MAG: HAD family hydrolase [Candidatus Eremiobacteraeota bacterium]|nr:HAD family hydrolase [Candidatus Eremiobacteraeota bacterium]
MQEPEATRHERALKDVKVIGFDADDTLWVNEPFYRERERQFCALLSEFLPEENAQAELFATEMANLSLYGYGVKGFTLSMIETALRVTAMKVPLPVVERIIQMGKSLIDQPIELIEGVEAVLKALQGRFRLIIATKGDLLDQERKLTRSGLSPYFHHIEIMSDKKEGNYRSLLGHLDIEPCHFAMVGNSMKSDIEPVLRLGGFGIHVPFHTTWQHEESSDAMPESDRFYRINGLDELTGLFESGVKAARL